MTFKKWKLEKQIKELAKKQITVLFSRNSTDLLSNSILLPQSHQPTQLTLKTKLRVSLLLAGNLGETIDLGEISDEVVEEYLPDSEQTILRM